MGIFYKYVPSKYKMTKYLGVLFILFYLLFSANDVYSQKVPSKILIGKLHININEHAKKQIQKDINRLTRHPASYQILVDRMNLYFPIIERVFKDYNIPDEIKYLIIQESALVADAVSVSNAVGFWQLKDFTARELGLRVDRKIDERLNIVSSTISAAKYLNSHNKLFNNWIYSITAYNTGRTGALPYTHKSKFGAKHMTINNKTHWYVKKFIAYYLAFSPARGRKHSENLELAEIKSKANKSLDIIAKTIKVDSEILEQYNKWLKSKIIPNDKTYVIVFPTTEKYLKNLAKIQKFGDSSEFNENVENKIKKTILNKKSIQHVYINRRSVILSDNKSTISSLANKANITKKVFAYYNDIKLKDNIVPNTFYYVKKKRKRSPIGFHIARKKETMWDISQKYGIQLKSLIKKNRTTIDVPIKVGQIIWLKKKKPVDQPLSYYSIPTEPTSSKQIADTIIILPETKRNTLLKKTKLLSSETLNSQINRSPELIKVTIHTIAKGETLWQISQRYNVKVADLIRWNDIKDINEVTVGQNINVKAPIEELVSKKTIDTHVVKIKETLYSISRKYNMTVDDIMKLNKLTNTSISLGDRLKVFKNQTN